MNGGRLLRGRLIIIHKINRILGSGEIKMVFKWEGELETCAGEGNEGMRDAGRGGLLANVAICRMKFFIFDPTPSIILLRPFVPSASSSLIPRSRVNPSACTLYSIRFSVTDFIQASLLSGMLNQFEELECWKFGAHAHTRCFHDL